MRFLWLIAVVLVVPSLAVPARAGMIEGCVLEPDPTLQIVGCTAVIRSGEWPDGGPAWAYLGRGIAYNLLGEHAQAIEDYSQALRLAPGNAKAYNGRAWSLYIMGRNTEALSDVNRSVSLNPSDVRTIDTRAHVQAALGRHSEALGEFERAMRAGGVGWIRTYQKALVKHGYYHGRVDGSYGPVTRAALAACLNGGCRLLE